MNADARETLGSLFTGCGGLDLGMELGARLRTVWQCQHDPDSKRQPCNDVLTRHWPGVPNLGNITDVDWASVEPPTVLAGGFPCQDVSNAGLGAGITVGTRSGLWFEFARAIRVLRPRVVVVENVGALLRRGMGIVIGDLAEAGYDTRWCCFRAADLGAPHGRERVFIVATDTGSSDGRPDSQGRRDPAREDVVSAERNEDPGRAGAHSQAHPVADTDRQGRPRPEHERKAGRDRPSDRGEADSYGWGLEERSERDRWPDEPGLEASLGHDADGRDTASADPASWSDAFEPASHDGDRAMDGPELGAGGGAGAGDLASGVSVVGGSARVEWGAYEPAIQRWAGILGRPAPAPTDDRGRLNPAFVEWMLGYPAGWTDGVTRTARLKMLGNSVQVQQGELVGLAVRRLLATVSA